VPLKSFETLGPQGHRKGFKGFKGFKVKRGEELPPFLKGKRHPPCGGQSLPPTARKKLENR